MSNRENAQIFYSKFSYEVEKRELQPAGDTKGRKGGCFVLGFFGFFLR